MANPVDLLRELSALGALGGGERRNGEYAGVKALMLAVLEEGIRAYCARTGRLRTEAEHWVRSNLHAPFSFATICETLELEPDAVRRALPRLRTEPLPRRIRRNVRKTNQMSKYRRVASR